MRGEVSVPAQEASGSGGDGHENHNNGVTVTTPNYALAVPEAVDVTDPGTWPGPARDYVGHWAERLAGTTRYPSDLRVPLEDEDRFVDLLGNHPLLVQHCSRLLDLEIGAIRRDGLAPLTRELVEGKLDAALAAGALTEEQRTRLGSEHVYAHENADGRDGVVCVTVGRAALDDEGGHERLLGIWGGEGIYWAFGDDSTGVGATLRTLGRPAIVTLGIDLSRPGRDQTQFFPSLHRLFVAGFLGLDDVCGDAFIPTAVPGHEVVDIWHPGDAEYDRHPALPRG